MKKETAMKIIFGIGITLVILSGLSAALLGTFIPAAVAALCLGALLCGVYAFTEKESLIKLVTSRNARHGVNSVIYSLIVIGIVIFVQAIAAANSRQFDLTKTQKFSLSGQTLNALKGLKKDVDAYYFYSVTARNDAAEGMLKLYERNNSRFKYSPVDADKNPGIAKRFNVTRYGVVVMNRRDNNAVNTVEDLTEEGLTNGLIKLVKDSRKKIYFTTGHGEANIDSPANDKSGYGSVRAALGQQNFDTAAVELFKMAQVPADAGVVIIAGPQVDIFPQETVMLKNYLNNGGNIYVMLPPFTKEPNLESLLAVYGIKAHNDIVVDKMSRMLGGDFLMPIISTYEAHEITKNFTAATFLPMCRTFELKGDIKGVKTQALARTNPGSWGETDLAGVKKGAASESAADLKSPLVVEAVAEVDNGIFAPQAAGNTTAAKAKIAVSGSSEYANNTYLGTSGNRDMFLNTVSYLADESDMISIRPKEKSFEPLFLPAIIGRMLFLIPILFLPMAVIAAGIVVFIRRRSS